MHVPGSVAIDVVAALEREGLLAASVAARIAKVVGALPAGRGLIFEIALDSDRPVPVDFALRCSTRELGAMLRGCAALTDGPLAPLADEFGPLDDLGAIRNWLEFDTGTEEPGVPSLFAQYRDPRLAAAAVRLLPGAKSVPDLPDAAIRHLGKMYGRCPADVRVVWSGLDLDRIDALCRALRLSERVAAVVGERPGDLHLALSFAPALQPRFGVEWMVRRLPAWEVPGISAAAAELLALWRRIPARVPGVHRAEVSHLKWTFEADRTAQKAYLYLD